MRKKSQSPFAVVLASRIHIAHKRNQIAQASKVSRCELLDRPAKAPSSAWSRLADHSWLSS
jgi:hypothetical protein